MTIPYGNTHKDGAARIEKSRRKQDWAWRSGSNRNTLEPIDWDGKNRRPVVVAKFPPEVMQAAEALGVTPEAICAEARKIRAIVKLAAKFSR